MICRCFNFSQCEATKEELEKYFKFIRWREDTEFSCFGTFTICFHGPFVRNGHMVQKHFGGG